MNSSRYSPNWYWHQLGAKIVRANHKKIKTIREIHLLSGESFCALHPRHENEVAIGRQLNRERIVLLKESVYD